MKPESHPLCADLIHAIHGGQQAVILDTFRGSVSLTAEWFTKHSPEVGGYLVVHRDDTKEEFTYSYSPTHNLEGGFAPDRYDAATT